MSVPTVVEMMKRIVRMEKKLRSTLTDVNKMTMNATAIAIPKVKE